jgi:hypothetical protein
MIRKLATTAHVSLNLFVSCQSGPCRCTHLYSKTKLCKLFFLKRLNQVSVKFFILFYYLYYFLNLNFYLIIFIYLLFLHKLLFLIFLCAFLYLAYHGDTFPRQTLQKLLALITETSQAYATQKIVFFWPMISGF